MTVSTRREWKNHLPILIISAGICLWALMAFVWLARLPVAVGHVPVAVGGARAADAVTADGVLFDAWSAETAQIDANARLTAIDGVPLRDIANLTGIENWTAGSEQVWTIEASDGSEQLVTVQLRPNPVTTTALLTQPLRYLFVIIFIGFCAILFVRRTDNSVAALLLLFSCAFAAYIIILSHRMRLQYWAEPATYFAILIPLFMLPKVMTSAIHHLLLVYPLPEQRFVQQPRRWIALLYGTPLLLHLLIIAVMRVRSGGNGLLWFESWFQAQQTLTYVWLLLTIPLLIRAGRRSRGEFSARMQFRLFVAAMLSYPVLIFVLFNVPTLLGVAYTPPQWVRPFLFVPMIGGVYVAVTRFRLFEMDRLLNRTLVYGLLTALIALLYAGLVAGIGWALQDRSSPVAVLATVVIAALLLSPVRDRLQNGVNRFMYGQRSDPLAVLTKANGLLASGQPLRETAQEMAALVQRSLRLPFVQLALEAGEFGVGSAENLPTTTFPLQTSTITLGHLHVAQRDDLDRFTPTEIGLLESIAQQTATSFHSRRLAQALTTTSKTAREDERKQIQRDLHDNLGPTLASMRMQLDMAQESMADDPVLAQRILDNLRSQTDEAVQEVRGMMVKDLPKPVQQLGLVGALSSLAEQFTIEPDLIVSFEQVGDLPEGISAEIQTTVYQFVNEALTNVIRHAEASRAIVTLSVDSELHVQVDDNGVGLGSSTESGIGTVSIRRRIEQLGGTFTLNTAPLGGVRASVNIPLA